MNHKKYKYQAIENATIIIAYILLFPVLLVFDLIKRDCKNGKIF